MRNKARKTAPSQRKAALSLPKAALAAAIASLTTTAASAGTIVGRVSDNTGTRSLAGARIEIPALGRSAVAASDGSFRFADVESGTYILVVSYAGVEPVEQEVSVVGEPAARVTIGLGSATDETVIVVGQRALMASSLSRQRNSDTVDSVLTRDAIGQFPDQNVAEALRRLPGINIGNDQGEGRYVLVRGLDPNLNSVSINGARVPAPESDVRYVALDVLPTELIESIEVKKTLTPDMDADTIGGSIEINTTSAFDRREPYLGLSMESSYNDLSGESSPKAGIDFSRSFGETFGIAGGISYYERSFSTDNIEPDGWARTDGGIVYAEEVQYRDYDVERERTGLSLSFDFRPSDQVSLYSRLLYSEFDDQEYRARLNFEFDEEPSAGSSESARFLSDDGEITVVRDLKDRFEGQKIGSLVVGGEINTQRWTFDAAASISQAEERENGSLDPVAFEQVFEDAGAFDVLFDYNDRVRPVFTVNAGMDAFLSTSDYGLDAVEYVAISDAEDEEAGFEFNASREIALASGSFELQFGLKTRFREKRYNRNVEFYEHPDFSLADVPGMASYGLLPIDPVPDSAATRAYFSRNFDEFSIDVIDSQYDSAIEDYRVDEDILAYYLAGRYENGPFSIVGGVRFEETENLLRGNVVQLVEAGGMYGDSVIPADTVFISSTVTSRDYDDVYPSVNLRYAIGDDFVIRGAYFESLVRPTMSYLAPRFELDEDLEGTFGNPNLQPYQASNFDISAEWYFGSNAVLSAGAFFKDIDDFIVVAEFEDVTINGVFAEDAAVPINGETATIEGLELAYQQALSGLGGPWNGLLLGVNYTYTDSEARAQGRAIPLPGAAENILNFMLGYEKNNLSLRLAATYRDEYLDELGGDPLADGYRDRYVKDHTQFDLSARYRVSDKLQLFVDLINLTDEPYVAYQPVPVRDRLLQYEEYSWTGKFGVRMNF